MKVNGEAVDLAYTYAREPRSRRWKNIALALNIDVIEVSEYLGNEEPAPSQQAPAVRYALDVKTMMEEKGQLTAIKQAVIGALESAEWAEVTEVGEDYSLWITGAQRWQRGNQLHGEVILELRTAAMLSRGTFVNNRRVQFRFDQEQVQKVGREHGVALQQEANEVASSCGSAKKLLSAVAGFQGINMSMLTSRIDVCRFVAGLYRSFQPEPVELVEASEVGGKTLRTVRAMLEQLD